MTLEITRVLASLLPILVLALLVPQGANAQTVPGEEDLGEVGPVANTGAYIELLKSDSAYQNMDREQQEAHLVAANEFITSDGAYEIGRNRLIVEISKVILQIQSTDDQQRLAGLKIQYDDLLEELEEYGVGLYNETEANPRYYFDKYEQALKRLEEDVTITKTHTGDVTLRNKAGILYPCFPGGFGSFIRCPTGSESYGPGTSHADAWVFTNGNLRFESTICLVNSVNHRSVNFQFKVEEDIYHIWGANSHYYDNDETKRTRTNGNANTCQLIANTVLATATDRAELDSILYNRITVSGSHT